MTTSLSAQLGAVACAIAVMAVPSAMRSQAPPTPASAFVEDGYRRARMAFGFARGAGPSRLSKSARASRRSGVLNPSVNHP